jgi:hypothetical protein
VLSIIEEVPKISFLRFGLLFVLATSFLLSSNRLGLSVEIDTGLGDLGQLALISHSFPFVLNLYSIELCARFILTLTKDFPTIMKPVKFPSKTK